MRVLPGSRPPPTSPMDEDNEETAGAKITEGQNLPKYLEELILDEVKDRFGIPKKKQIVKVIIQENIPTMTPINDSSERVNANINQFAPISTQISTPEIPAQEIGIQPISKQSYASVVKKGKES